MTDEEKIDRVLGFLRDGTAFGVSSNLILEVIALARIGAAVQPKPISEAFSQTGDIVQSHNLVGWENGSYTEMWFDKDYKEWRALNNHWTDQWGSACYPTHFIPLSALPQVKP